jgi:NADH-quinone oxidoreductase subunit G
MPKITVNGQTLEVQDGVTILQAAEQAGAEVPVFCYHSRLSVAGNCRMCLVEVEGCPKPIASCAMPVTDKMVVRTDSEMVQKARKGALEFLLINHPLDCPICDQGGECDLQDIAVSYGSGESRFLENKRAVKDKNMGPLISTSMNRCIHCTRCVRFAHDVAGAPEIGLVGRGEKAEITTYLESLLDSEMSGNVIDLCPVGALTSKPYAFQSRPWELKKTESIDVMDAVGSAIRVDSRGMKVLRILPRLNEDINEEWISDKARFACDGLSMQRLDRPYIRQGGDLKPASWDDEFSHIVKSLKPLKGDQIGAIAGDLVDCESMVLLKALMGHLQSPHIDCRQDGAALEVDVRGSYIFNTSIAGIEQADACLMVGGNVRYDAPLINARLRKRYLQGGFSAARIGGEISSHRRPTFSYEELGSDAKILDDIRIGRHPFAKVLEKAQCPMLILSQEALSRSDGGALLNLAREVAERYGLINKEWNGFNVLHNAAGRVGGLDLGLIPGDKGFAVKEMLNAAESGEIKALFLLGVDESNLTPVQGKTFTIYIGHHGDLGAHSADVILPGAAYTEKDGTYVNTEGRVQQTRAVIAPPGEAQEDWKILSRLCAVFGVDQTPQTINEVRQKLATVNPIFEKMDVLQLSSWGDFGQRTPLERSPFPVWEGNFFLDNAIARCSQTMAQCAQAGEWILSSEESLRSGTHD